MSGEVVVKLENVSKYYKLYNSPKDRLKEALNPFRKKYHKEFYALNNISFELRKGECLGVIGKNGMGKSTLLKIIANVIQPSSGSVQIKGSVSALLELGTGFNPEFTGIENIHFYGTILGFKKNEIEGKVKEIVEFADIGEFINQPVKTYSSGMFVRLAFAVQTSLKPDILLVDEVLSVGDIFFQQKCHARIEELMRNGTALMLVSHDLAVIEKYSSKIFLLENGTQLFLGNPAKAIFMYYQSEENRPGRNPTNFKQKFIFDKKINKIEIPNSFWPEIKNETYWENFEVVGDINIARLSRVLITSEEKEKRNIFFVNEKMIVYHEWLLFAQIGIPIGGVEIRNSMNIYIHGKNTLQYINLPEIDVNHIKSGSIVRFKQTFRLSLAPGEYIFSLGLAGMDDCEYEKNKNNAKSVFNTNVQSIIRIPQAGRFSIKYSEKKDDSFYGYTDLSGDLDYEIIE